MLGDVLPASEQSVSKIVIGPTGQVQGTIRADFIVIAGTVIGNVQALEALELQASAHVQSEATPDPAVFSFTSTSGCWRLY